MKQVNYLLFAILNTLLFSNIQISAHGLGANTQIKLYNQVVNKRSSDGHKLSECFQSIRQIYDYTMENRLKAKGN